LGIAGSFAGGLIFWAVADKPGKHPIVGLLVALACAAVLICLLVGSTTRASVFRRRRCPSRTASSRRKLEIARPGYDNG
jgi:hypothetical protein